MSTILRIGPFHFFFYSNENGEPAQIYIQRERMLAKFWLKPVALASFTRFSPKELRKLDTLVVENRKIFGGIGDMVEPLKNKTKESQSWL